MIKVTLKCNLAEKVYKHATGWTLSHRDDCYKLYTHNAQNGLVDIAWFPIAEVLFIEDLSYTEEVR